MAYTGTEQALLDEIPAGTEMTYAAFKAKVDTAGKGRMLQQHFHDLRKRKILVIRLDTEKDPPVPMVKRV